MKVNIYIFLTLTIIYSGKCLQIEGKTDKQKMEAVTAVLKGILDENNISNNNQLANCFDINLIPVYSFLDEGLKDPIAFFMDMDQALKKISGFMCVLHNCIFSTQEGQDLYSAYKLRKGILLDEVRDEVIQYSLLNPFDSNDYLDEAEEEWNNENYFQVGHLFAQLGHEIVDGSDLQEQSQLFVQQKKMKKINYTK